MSDAVVRGIVFALAAIIVFCTGFRLSRSGRPFGILLLSVHRLVAVAAVVFAVVLVHRAARAAGLPAIEWIIAVLAAVFCVWALASGNLLSLMKSAPGWMFRSHRIVAWLAGVAVALCLVVIV